MIHPAERYLGRTMNQGHIIKILITDDNLMFRKILRAFLDSKNGIEVVGEAENGQIAIQKVIELCPDVVLMDVNMPVLDGIEATSEIRRMSLRVKIIAVSNNDDEYYMRKMETAGASSFVSKDKIAEEIEQSIHNAVAAD